jgi:hypothetical protein
MLHLCNAQYSPKARLMCLTHHDPDSADNPHGKTFLYREVTQGEWEKLCSFDEDAIVGSPAYQYWEQTLRTPTHQEREMSYEEKMMADIMGLAILA